LLLLAFASVLGGWWRRREPARPSRRHWLLLFAFLWALANYAEAFFYLVLSAVWLKSDMETVVVASGVSRWVWAGTGLLLTIGVGRWLRRPATEAATFLGGDGPGKQVWPVLFVAYVAAVGTRMAAARIVLA